MTANPPMQLAPHLTERLAALTLSLALVAGARAVDLHGLLEDMLDRSKIAEFPQPEFVCKQASSYNRLSKTPGNPEWFLGCDFNQFFGSHEVDGRTEWIMLDVDGPGAVTRWWQTQLHCAGSIRIYLDGAREPVFTGTADQLVDGGLGTGPPLAANRHGGRNLYLPIPFRDHCRITFDGPNAGTTFKNESIFYNINYLQYPKGTDVKSLSKSELEANRELIAKVGRELLQPERHSLPVRRKTTGGTATLKPGQAMTRKVTEPGALAVLRVRLAADDMSQAMRSSVISMSFDGKRTVCAPVGEFFGSGLGIHPFQDWWRCTDKDGWMTCWWPMPFRQSAEVSIANRDATAAVDVSLDDIGIADWQWTERSMYFHTAWRGAKLIRFGSNSDPGNIKDWNYVSIGGKGVYVGDSLSLYNRPVMGGPLGAWWGEGDEKIRVDGEAFPSHFGTGSEDYYGYAFNSPEPFSSPFHAQPVATGNMGIGHTTNERVRIHDRIPFRTSFQFDMELYHWQPNVRNDYATTTHWYAFDGATDNGDISYQGKLNGS